MYIAEWSVVKDIGEAKLHPFFFFSIQETTDPYQVIPPSLTRQRERVQNGRPSTRISETEISAGKNSPTKYTCFLTTDFFIVAPEIVLSLS